MISTFTWRYVGSQWIALDRWTGDTLAWCVVDHADRWWVVWPATPERPGPFASAAAAQEVAERRYAASPPEITTGAPGVHETQVCPPASP